MIPNRYPVSSLFRWVLIGTAAAGLALAQDQAPPAPATPPPSTTPPSGGWRRVGDPPAAPAPAPSAQPQTQDPSQPTDRTDAYGQPLPAPSGDPQDAPPVQQQGPPPQDMPQAAPGQQMAPPNAPPPAGNRPAYGLPAQVTMQAGTVITTRINQPLSTDHNLVGDTFSATLTQPMVVNGVVVAQRGQLVYGSVTEIQKQHSDKPSRLGVQLTGITLADGTQLPVKSTLFNQQGGHTPGGIEAGRVVGTTVVGTAVGGAIGWGTGAAIGAGAGALVGLAAVLATHNHPTIVYPETVLMFQTTVPVTIPTGTSQAFRYVGPNDYSPGVQMQMRPPARAPVYPGYGTAYAPYGAYPYGYPYPYPYPYAYPYYPYYPYWGGVGFYFGGGRFFGGRWR